MYMPYPGDNKTLYHYNTEDLVRIFITPFKKMFSRMAAAATKSKTERKLSLG